MGRPAVRVGQLDKVAVLTAGAFYLLSEAPPTIRATCLSV